MINLGEQLRDGVLFIPGTDELSEWLHHITPGARRREIEEAIRILEKHNLDHVHTIVGLSLGASIAQILAALYTNGTSKQINVYLIGGKRAPRPYVYTRAVAIRNAGDVVTAMPPWRPKNPNETTRSLWMWPWEAHAWDNYADLLKRFGAI